MTVHNVAGYSYASSCPICGRPLPETPKPFPGERHDIHRRLLREPVAAAAARRELDAIAPDLELEELQIVALLMTELIANSVKHGGREAGEHLELEVAVMPERIRVEVRDGSAGFVPAPRDDADPSRHWGLHLVEEFSSRWQVELRGAGDQSLVWFELDRARADLV